MAYATDSFVGKVNRNAQPSFFDKPALNAVEQFTMFDEIGELFFAANSIAVLVNIANAIFPDAFLPRVFGDGRFQDSFVAVDGSHLAGLFIDRHLRNQVRNAFLNGQFRIFVGILFPILVSVDPTIVVDPIRLCFLSRNEPNH